jgi:peptidoglycan hydrolase-like protein with peptidoglycan-binding domain
MMRALFRRYAAIVLAAILCLASIISAPAETKYATLRYGSKGEAVRAMQQALTDQGYDTNGVDGVFGRGTETAVKKFQKAKGLKADGLAGNQTLTALYAEAGEPDPQNTASSSPASQATPTPAPTQASSGGGASGTYATLRYGSKGSAVKTMQKALITLGYDLGAADGIFGRGTEKAVKQFQKNNKLKADGLAGNATLKLLYKQEAAAKPTAKPTATPTAKPSNQPSNQPSVTPTNTPKPTTSATPTPGIPTRTLKKGMTGPDVKLVQQKLKELKYYKGSINSKYDDATMKAVKAFQTNNGLTSDGLAGPKTYTVLFGNAPRNAEQTPPPSYATLKLNATGAAVTKLQTRLKELGYKATVTGTYSTETREAVADFQNRNGLVSDGVAGSQTQLLLYSTDAKDASTPLPQLEEGAGIIDGPSKSQVQLLHWYDVVKPSMKSGQNILVFDPATKRSWTLRLYALGHHADSEPLTLRDTQIMRLAFGGKTTWTPKPVYVKLPDGRWTVAATHDTPHLSGAIIGNDFDGHLCVHFLRDMEECKINDPDYGVTNQNVIRAAWKALTGQTYVEVVR